MRKILFRGFHPDENDSNTITLNGENIKGEWIFGSLLQIEIAEKGIVPFIIPTRFWFLEFFKYEVLPETVGQYTGLTDKNGKKIFEGDIGCWRSNKRGYQVSFEECRFKIEDYYGNQVKPTQGAINHLEFEIIGNIYEDAELLEVEE